MMTFLWMGTFSVWGNKKMIPCNNIWLKHSLIHKQCPCTNTHTRFQQPCFLSIKVEHNPIHRFKTIRYPYTHDKTHVSGTYSHIVHLRLLNTGEIFVRKSSNIPWHGNGSTWAPKIVHTARLCRNHLSLFPSHFIWKGKSGLTKRLIKSRCDKNLLNISQILE